MRTNSTIIKITLTILGCIFFQTSFCQENYLPGYIIRSSSDTLHGFIDYRNLERNPEKISFKEALNADKAVYTPLDIKEFGIQDERFVSAIVETEISTENTLYLDINSKLKFKTDTAFLQAVITGPKSLYYYTNKTGKKNFYIQQDTVYELLIHKQYLIEQEGKTLIKENKRYLGQLSLYLYDCSSIQSKLTEMEYTLEKLVELFQFYYKRSHTVIKFQKKTENLSTELGLTAGLSMTSLKFGNNYSDYFLVSNYNHSVNFATGLFFNIILSKNQMKWSVYNELEYTSYKVSGSSVNYMNENYYTNSYTTFGYSYIKMINLLRYTYPVGKLFVFVNAGVSNGFVISETNHLKQEVVFYAPPTINEMKALKSTKLYEQGYVAGLGTKYKRFTIEVRFEKGNGMSVFNALSSVTTRYYFLLGYRF